VRTSTIKGKELVWGLINKKQAEQSSKRNRKSGDSGALPRDLKKGKGAQGRRRLKSEKNGKDVSKKGDSYKICNRGEPGDNKEPTKKKAALSGRGPVWQISQKRA